MKTAKLWGFAAALMALASGNAVAQTAYPQGPVTIIVGSPAGGGADALGRLMANYMSRTMGQPFVVENRPGGGGAVAAIAAARANPDGHTLYLSPEAVFQTLPISLPNFPIKPLEDFAPVGFVGNLSVLLVTNADGPKTFDDLLEKVRAAKGQYSYASPGFGSPQHFAAELLAETAGFKWEHIAYKGAAPMMTDLAAGHVTVGFTGLAPLRPFLANGRARVLAVVDRERLADMPNVPAISERYKDVIVDAWLALFVPAKTPAGIVEQLDRVTTAAKADPEVRKGIEALGFKPMAETRADLAQRIRSNPGPVADMLQRRLFKPE